MAETLRIPTEDKKKAQAFLEQCDQMGKTYKRVEKNRQDTLITALETEDEVVANSPALEYAFEMGNTTVSLGGYWHELPYFEKNQKEIENHIKGADVLVTELATLAEGVKTQDDDFFQKVERLAWKNKVPVVCNDPHLHPRIKSTGILRDALQDADGKIIELKAETFLAAAGITTGALGLGIYDRIQSKVKGATMSRRSFLLGGIGAGAAMVTAGSLYNTAMNGHSVSPWNRRTTAPVGALMFDYEDFRDVSTAYTIATLAKSLPKGSRVAVAYGAAHMRPIKHYLDNPTELAIKMAMYKTAYGDAIPASIVHTPKGEELNSYDPGSSWTNEPQETFVLRKQKESNGK